MATSTKPERTFRAFVRAQFHARLARDDDKQYLTTIRGNVAKTEVRNPDTVLAWMHKKCKLVNESRSGATFLYQAPKREGGMTATVALKHIGDRDVFTMTTK